MLKTLVKKQFWECLRSWFINPRTGRARGKWGKAGIVLLFAVLLVSFGSMFFGLAYMMQEFLAMPNYCWLPYSLMGTLSLLLGVIGSVFSTYAMLYRAKDNDLLLAMPIPPGKILLSRMTLVYALALIYSGIVWLPTIVCFWIFSDVTPAMVVFQILLLPVLALLVTVLTCALGWVVALISAKVKNKNLLIVVLSLAFIVGYYYLTMNITGMLTSLIANAASIGRGVRKWAYLLWQLGLAASGDGKAMLIFTAVTLTLAAICMGIMVYSFRSIVTGRRSAEKHSGGKLTVHSSGMVTALLRRELQRFTSSATYMLNGGIGLVLLLVGAVLLMVRGDAVRSYLNGFLMFAPAAVKNALPLLMMLAMCMVSAMNAITAPSISLEGKTLWILRSLPVSGRQVLNAKLGLHMLLNLVPGAAAMAAVSWLMKVTVPAAVLGTAFCIEVSWFVGLLGLITGVLHPNFQWTSEVVPIKQSMNVAISLLAGWLTIIAAGAGGFLLLKTMGLAGYLALCTGVLLIVCGLLQYWLNTKGAAIFDSL